MVSAVNSASSAPAVQKAQVVSTNARAADGDYKTKGVGRSAVKDADGDYKPTSTQATSSSPVQAALTLLKLGG
ncbi:hypothetical protein SAMN05444161_7265 [Rhizobiales bacterium GAS191]|nr:hypothetical protein SAMN05444161_7265 [Rhizobiales bacterium GAS191]